jgi:iron complex transport system substrate-binding protein
VRPGKAALLSLVLFSLGACTEAPAPDDRPTTFNRVVTLAPNLAELVHAAGAGQALVGVSAYSDFPIHVRELPVIGDAFMIDQERLALLRPDLLLVWQGGTPAHVVDELRNVGYNVEVLRTSSLIDVADAIIKIGTLTGYETTAHQAASDYQKELDVLAASYQGRDDISVFYQVSRRPLFTINGDHYVSELIALCGGSNVFADLGELAPTVDVESVVERDPEVLLASTDAGDDAFAEWDRWPRIAANRYDNHFLMPADAIGRATPRLVQAARAVCLALDEARKRRAAAVHPTGRGG